ncbi:hypothetical protein HDU97_001459 [Phlyctochytrium planicorne]|nr:hypothetical protein HDU97_001459 [Phlyctochytrium planicorne]
MKPLSIVAAVAAAAGVLAQSQPAPLLPPEGQLYLGAWFDRVQSDLPSAVNSRIKGIPGEGLSFFQTDFDLAEKEGKPTIGILDGFVDMLDASGTDAFAYITVYFFKKFTELTDDKLTELANRLLKVLKRGKKIFLRLYPEMNGYWFEYGLDPEGFIKAWKQTYDIINKVIGTENRQNIAYVWAPNSGNGYPFNDPDGLHLPTSTADPRFKLFDTNNDNKIDRDDNAYTPYYPGDNVVDWVGLSIYHYGPQDPWVVNQVPEDNKFEGLMQGRSDINSRWGTTPFYTIFSSPDGFQNITKGNKPFMLAEGSVSYHFAYTQKGNDKGFTGTPNLDVSRVDMKQAWWRQYLNKDFLTKYPNFKSACTFEFIKSEEETWRDFSTFGLPPVPSNFSEVNQDAVAVGKAFVEDAKKMDFIKWAAKASATTATGPTETNPAPTSSVTVSQTTTTKPSSSASLVPSHILNAALALLGAAVTFAMCL